MLLNFISSASVNMLPLEELSSVAMTTRPPADGLTDPSHLNQKVLCQPVKVTNAEILQMLCESSGHLLAQLGQQKKKK